TAPCSLLVPSAASGGTPAAKRAGSAISPPPPAMASTKPAARPAAPRAARIKGSGTVAGSLARSPAISLSGDAWQRIRVGGSGHPPLGARNVDHLGHESRHHELDADHQRR